MSRGLKWFLGIFITLLILTILLLQLVKSHDGPLEIISGGPFTSGVAVHDVTDWAFMDEFPTIELQTMAPPRSRIMWLVVVNNRMYVMSNYMNSHIGRMWKQWPHQVRKDNRALVRADGKLYELQLTRILDSSNLQEVSLAFKEKYSTPISEEDIRTENTWIFELTPRGGR